MSYLNVKEFSLLYKIWVQRDWWNNDIMKEEKLWLSRTTIERIPSNYNIWHRLENVCSVSLNYNLYYCLKIAQSLEFRLIQSKIKYTNFVTSILRKESLKTNNLKPCIMLNLSFISTIIKLLAYVCLFRIYSKLLDAIRYPLAHS